MTEPSEVEAMGVVQADIEEARHELQRTVDELAGRLDPRKRAEGARDAVEESARRVVAQAEEVARNVAGELQRLRTMSPDEAAEVARDRLDQARQWLQDDRHRKQAAAAAGLVLLLLVVRRRRH